MLRRQQSLLQLIHEFGEPISHTRLVKLAFLASVEENLNDIIPFYDFVPYRFGPFSFSLYRELGGLEVHGFVTTQNEKWQISGDKVRDAKQLIERLPAEILVAIRNVLTKYKQIPQRRLVADVYSRFPWFSINSDLVQLIPRNAPRKPTASKAVYTIGYEGQSIDRFMNTLLKAGMQRLVDVRANPLSRKYGFSKKSLSDICHKLGIAYDHRPELGISSKERASLDDYESYQILLDRYESEMLPKRGEAIARLQHDMLQESCALLCVEADVTCCHRGRLASRVAELNELPVVHL